MTTPIFTADAALDRIAQILSGSEWDADTASAVADVVRLAGREVLDVDECPFHEGGSRDPGQCNCDEPTVGSPSVTWEVCDVCAQALVNGDCSSTDLDGERFDAFVADHGPMVRVTENRRDGYWDCEVCRQTQIGSGHLFGQVS